MKPSKNLTTTQAAEALGISPSRVRKLIIDGVLRATKFGRDHVIDPKDLDAVRDRPRPGRPPKKTSK